MANHVTNHLCFNGKESNIKKLLADMTGGQFNLKGKTRVYNVEQIEDYKFTFLSAWASPFSAMKLISRLHPEVEISVRYFDDDFGANVGEYKLSRGRLVYKNKPKSYTEESYMLAIDIDGGCDYYIEELLGVNKDDSIDDPYTSACLKVAHNRGAIYDGFPNNVLSKLLELAVNSEQYERAGVIKKLLEKTIT
jgi:hypothetical protein